MGPFIMIGEEDADAGKKSKEKVEVFSYELLAYRAFVHPDAMPASGYQ